MSSNVDSLILSRVIGDVVDMFEPSVKMDVYYASKHVTNGCSIKPSAAANAPRVTINGDPDQLYTMVMTDPDAPSPSEPYMREWVCWILTDIPGYTNSSRGKEVLAYMGPCPPVGIHRYIFVLFKQDKPLGFLEPPLSRGNFRTREFAERLKLGEPVAIVYYNANKEPACRRRN